MKWNVIVSVNSAFHSITKYQTLDGLNRRNLFLMVSEIGSLRSRCQQGPCLVRGLCLGSRQLHFCCIFTWPSLVWCMQVERSKLSGVSSYKGTQSHHENPTFMPCLNLTIFQRPHLQMPHQELRLLIF